VRIVESVDKIWRVTGIYGEPRWQDKFKTWEKIRELNQNNTLPWIIIGDFNEILYSHEKEGGNIRPQAFMDAFRDTLMDYGLEDLGFSGDVFTWKRGRIRERLDRGVANGPWMTMHPAAGIQHLEFIKSDHWPILLETEIQSGQVNNRSKVKHFEARWLQENGFKEKVQQTWESVSAVSPSDGVLTKLGKLHEKLHKWDANVLQKPKYRLKKAQQDLEQAMRGPMNDENELVAKEMATLIDLLLKQQEIH
jgi:hypothetical protein